MIKHINHFFHDEKDYKEMRALIVMILLSCMFRTAFAPGTGTIYIIMPQEINFYDPLIRAIAEVESHGGIYLYNQQENAVGPLQIREIRVTDYNQLTGSNYRLEDFYDYELSRKMFLYYARGKSWEKACRDWNGSGHMTAIYWKKIQKKLNT
jgi:hypothetical protein